ncbi:hypothetical protein NQ318_008304 [Aromia moschata]|uniref:Uncharacterized protein n=1 Tax=Aromia moschata TaxID=1265417 RepID=A0AAV8Y8C8_9CUCU|nr:hypothetical protein NQ318_008304 [Aromia moschata]
MNSMDFLLTNKDITYEIRTEIKRLGRPIPDLIISKTDIGKSQNYSRTFNSMVATEVHGLKKGYKEVMVLKLLALFVGTEQQRFLARDLHQFNIKYYVASIKVRISQNPDT